MSRLPDSMSIGQLREYEKANPQMPQYAHRMTCTTYEQFVTTLYGEVDTIVAALVKDANVLQGSQYSENALNADICRQLNGRGYQAHHDKNNRGHTDISVEYGRFIWIGEGKKVQSADTTHLRNGYDQLVHRYVSGIAGADQAGLLIYCYAPATQHVIAKWSAHLVDENAVNAGYAENVVPCAGNEALAFWSDNNHISSGAVLKIKHIALSLHWSPPKSS